MTSGGTAHKGFGYSDLSLKQSFFTFLSMTKKQVIEFSRYPISFVAEFSQVLLIIGMFMFAAIIFIGEGGAGLSRIAGIMMYGFVLNMFLIFVLWEIGFSIREEQYRGTLESLYLSPVNKFSNLTSRIFAIVVWTVVMVIIALVVVSHYVGGLPAENVLLALVVLFFSITGILGIGFMAASLILRLKESANLLINVLQFFFMIFCAMFFPFSALPPEILNTVTRWIPLSYGVDLFRSILVGQNPELLAFGYEIVIVVLFGILSPVVGYLLYKRGERKARLKGTLGEY
ncbi:MAG: ABC transporter permease [Methanomassiliicoccales archaeon]|nr:MAG: ABC transporter permease [Methanomassiliicoccales archaeon]